MTMRLGVVMDPIGSIHYKKDSTLAMLWEAASRGWEIYYFEQSDIFLMNGAVLGNSRRLSVFKDPERWFELGEQKRMALSELDVILMRKDPPFNREYIYTTYLLEQVERDGVLVINKPSGLRDANEKFFTAWFSECCPKQLISRDIRMLREFYEKEGDIVCKPLDVMGGMSVFHLRPDDPNVNVVFETLTRNGAQSVMVQQFIPEITAGDKRILIINGAPVPFALARIPGEKDWRGNLSAGAKGIAQPLSARDKKICDIVGPVLRARGLFFVGIDVIGDYLTEINVTSPTCIRELDEQCNLNISATFLDCIEQQYDAPSL